MVNQKCRFCESSDVEQMISFNHYPIFIGCSDGPREEDELYLFEIYLCNNCQIIQQINIPPTAILYRKARAFGIGQTWKKHYEMFYSFLVKSLLNAKIVLEIGGGNGVLLSKLLQQGGLTIVDVEPKPQYSLSGVKTIKRYFDAEFQLDYKVDVIYASHLIEHISDVNVFFDKVYTLLSDDGDLVIACPNIQKSFHNMHLNAFATDHFNYFTRDSLQKLAEKHGFYVKDCYQYVDHGMYFRFSKRSFGFDVFTRTHSILDDFKIYEQKIKGFVNCINAMGLGCFYLFGAHAFTITFLRYLKNEDKVVYVLDNESTKTDKRLTGTNIICKRPEVIKADINPVVIIYMGAYSNEICEQLVSINKNVKLIRLDREGAPNEK